MKVLTPKKSYDISAKIKKSDGPRKSLFESSPQTKLYLERLVNLPEPQLAVDTPRKKNLEKNFKLVLKILMCLKCISSN